MSNNNRAWAFFGKASAIIAALATLLSIFFAIFPAEPKIRAIGQYHTFELPPDLTALMESLHEQSSWSSLINLLNKIQTTNDVKTSFDLCKLASPLSEELGKAWENKFDYRIPYKCVANLTIKNHGNREATDVVLDAPVDGIALITTDDGSNKVKEFKRTLPLGSLRPQNKVDVTIWTIYSVSSWDEDNFRITHKDGIAKIKFAKSFNGFAKFIAQSYDVIAFLILWVIASYIIKIVFRKYFTPPAHP